jgi:hypothetical protein
VNSNSTMKAYQEAPAGASPKNSHPALLWPIPEGCAEVEVTRWWHEPTETRIAWEWVYIVSVSCSEWNGHVRVCLRASRRRQDYITKRLSSPEIVAGWHEAGCTRSALKSKRAPPEVARAFSEMVAQVRRAAEKHEAAYERAMDREDVW